MKTITVYVADIIQPVDNIKIFKLISKNYDNLPRFSPGSNIFLKMNLDGCVNYKAYSLINDPWDTGAYEIAVLRRDDSHGGSSFMHNLIQAGSVLETTYPRNNFPINKLARKHILIAGGIGVTPFITYVRYLVRYQLDFEMHYAFKLMSNTLFHNQFIDIIKNYYYYCSNDGKRMMVEDILKDQPLGAHVYVCGPKSLIEKVISVAEYLNWPRAHLHYELFDSGQNGNHFAFELKNSNIAGSVPKDVTLLEALENLGVDIPYGCRSGACGLCATRVISGDIEHRDCYLSDDEKKEGNIILPCVSRGHDKITLDL